MPHRAVLVVDDDRGKRAALAAALAPLRVEVVEAASGDEALRQLEARDFAAVLMDVRMRPLDGYQAAELIRALPRSRQTPLIFVTAYGEDEVDISRGYALGAIDYIHHPIRPEVLRAKVQVLVELAQERENARLAVESQDEFGGLIAHELRAPLSVIRGYLSMLADGTLGEAPEAWGGPLRILTHKVGELDALVDDLLFSARLEAGLVPFEPETIDLAECARTAAREASARAQLLRASVRVEGTSVAARADQRLLSRILANLVNNALTYSAAMPEVRLVVSDGAEPVVRVEDRGVGIPAAQQPRVFEKGYRIVRPELDVPGTGLGLYISRRLAERMGGRLELERSEVGWGTVFRLELPPARA